jgi:hypothetical protein
MTASATSKTAIDGVQNPFPAGLALETVSQNFVQTTYLKEPVGETIITPSQDGTDGTGITIPTGGAGIRGWLSGIYKLLGAPIISNMNGAMVTSTPTVTAGAYSTAGFVVGGIQSFPLILNPVNSIATLESITLRFKATKQTTEFDVSIFSASPAGTYSDHGLPVIAAADSAILLGVYRMAFVSATQNSPLGTHTIYNLDNICKKLVGTTTGLWAVVTMTASMVAPVSTSEMSLTLAVDW